MSVISHRPPDKKVSKFVSHHFMKLKITFHFSNFVFLDTLQECVPGITPGPRSWETSRNAFLDKLLEPFTVLSLNVGCLDFDFNTFVSFSAILCEDNLFRKMLLGGDGVK